MKKNYKCSPYVWAFASIYYWLKLSMPVIVAAAISYIIIKSFWFLVWAATI